MRYNYITVNNLENRQKYSYSEFGGREFLRVYQETRRVFIQKNEESSSLMYDTGILSDSATETEGKLRQITLSDQGIMHHVIKEFEVRKRLYGAYDWDTWKPIPESGYQNMGLYLLFAELLLDFYTATNGLKYLNCLLKVDDTLLSMQARLNTEQRKRLSKVLKQELVVTGEIMQSKIKDEGDRL